MQITTFIVLSLTLLVSAHDANIAASDSFDDSFNHHGRSFDISDNWAYCTLRTISLSPDTGARDFGTIISEHLASLSAAGGGTVRLRSGIYPLRTTIQLPARTCLLGADTLRTVLRVVDNADPSPEAKGIIRSADSERVTIRKFTLDANGRRQHDVNTDAHFAKYGVYFEHVNYTWIDAVRVVDAIGYGCEYSRASCLHREIIY